MQEMRHRNIINLQNWYETDRQVTLILEYAHGGGLFNLIANLKQSNKRLSIKTIQHYSYQILNGIQYIHSLNYSLESKIFHLFQLTRSRKPNGEWSVT